MINVLPAASSLNFLAGIFAGAGINLVTSVATGPENGISSAKIGLDSLLWVLAAAFLTWAAQSFQRAEREADRVIGGDFSPTEERDVRDQYQRRALRRAWLPLLLTAASLIGGVLALPRFIDWGAVF